MLKKMEWGRSFVRIMLTMIMLFFMISNISIAEEQYVIDKINIFTQAEFQQLTENAAALEAKTSAKIVIYIDETFPIDDALKFAKQKYKEYHLPSNGVILVLATEGQIAAYTGDSRISTKMTDEALDSIVPLLQDGNLAAGMIELQKVFINYLGGEVIVIPTEQNTQEANTIEVEKREENKKSKMSLLYILVSVFLVFLNLADKMRLNKTRKALEEAEEKNELWPKKMEEHEQEIYERLAIERNKVIARDRDICKLKEELQKANNEIECYEADFEVIRLMHPKIVEEVEAHYRKLQEEADKQKAKKFDEDFVNVMKSCSVTRTNIVPFRNLLRQYESLSDGEKRWVSSNIEVLKNSIRKAEELQRQYEAEQEKIRCENLARTFESSAQNLINSNFSMGLEETNRRAETLFREYQNLPLQARNMLNGAIMVLWQRFYSKVQQDWRIEEERREAERREQRRCEEEERRRRERERREAEERRRKMNSYSSSSCRSSSSFGGSGSSRSFGSSSRSSGSSRSFGGGSSRGGGAGRSF